MYQNILVALYTKMGAVVARLLGQDDGHLPKARVESCSAATTLALYVKNFPG